MTRSLRQWFAGLLLAAGATVALAQDTVVYHLDNAQAQALKGLRKSATISTSIRRHASSWSPTPRASTF